MAQSSVIALDSTAIPGILSAFFRNDSLYVSSHSISGIEDALMSEPHPGNALYNFKVNAQVKTDYFLCALPKSAGGFFNLLRIATFARIQSVLQRKGKTLEIYDDGQSLNGRVKRAILRVKPRMPEKIPNESLRSFILADSLKELPDFKFPKYLHVALTNRCNLKCIMCPYHSPTLKQQEHKNDYFFHGIKMPEDLLRKIIDEAGENKSSITFGQYDEPMLYKNFIDHVGYAKQKGCKVSLTTNGTYVEGEKAEKLLDTGIDHISFSLDAATPESYRTIRGDDFSIPLENIRNLVKVRNRKGSNASLRACMVVQEHNRHEKEAFKELMKEVGVDMISYYNLSVYKDGIWMNETMNFNVDEQMPERYACSQLWSQAMLYPDGKLSLCCASTMYVSYREDIPYLGNVKDEKIADIWFNARYQKVRNEALNGKFSDNSICKDCQIWHNFMGREELDAEGNKVHMNPYETFITFAKA